MVRMTHLRDPIHETAEKIQQCGRLFFIDVDWIVVDLKLPRLSLPVEMARCYLRTATWHRVCCRFSSFQRAKAELTEGHVAHVPTMEVTHCLEL